MKPGTQADVIRELKNEHGISCSRTAISKLVNADDHRIVKTPKGKIEIEATVKLLIDSGFGSRTKPLKKSPTGSDKKTNTAPTEKEIEELNGAFDVENLKGVIDPSKIPGQPASKKVKEYYSALLEKIKYQKAFNEVIDVKSVKKERFETGRMIRDNLLNISGRVADKCYGQTKHEIEQIIDHEIKAALFSVIGE